MRSAPSTCATAVAERLTREVPIVTMYDHYKDEPKIDVGTLKAIRRLVSVPLVLYGGSGTPEDVLRMCIQNGICKFNVNTETSTLVVDRFRAMFASGKDFHPSKLSLEAVGLVTRVARKYIGIFMEEENGSLEQHHRDRRRHLESAFERRRH